jgi:hypothetical protein
VLTSNVTGSLYKQCESSFSSDVVLLSFHSQKLFFFKKPFFIISHLKPVFIAPLVIIKVALFNWYSQRISALVGATRKAVPSELLNFPRHQEATDTRPTTQFAEMQSSHRRTIYEAS